MPPEYHAVDCVFGAVGVAVFGGYQRIVTGLHAYDQDLLTIPAFYTTAEEYGLDAEELLREPYAFIDRNGVFWAPFGVARKLAHELCRRHAREVLEYVRAKEEALQEASVSGRYINKYSRRSDPYMDPEFAKNWLRKQEPVHALVYHWCGDEARKEFDREQAFRAEIQRLRKLVTSAADFLATHGHPLKSKLLLKGLNEHHNSGAEPDNPELDRVRRAPPKD